MDQDLFLIYLDSLNVCVFKLHAPDNQPALCFGSPEKSISFKRDQVLSAGDLAYLALPQKQPLGEAEIFLVKQKNPQVTLQLPLTWLAGKSPMFNREYISSTGPIFQPAMLVYGRVLPSTWDDSKGCWMDDFWGAEKQHPFFGVQKKHIFWAGLGKPPSQWWGI